VKFWPFVIAVGRYEDFSFVVIPELISRGSRNFWRVPAFRANQAADEIRILETLIDGSEARCVYRTTFIDDKSGPVLDSAGRPIFKSVGFLTFDAIGGNSSQWAKIISAIEAEYREAIGGFVGYRSPPSPEWTPALSTARLDVSPWPPEPEPPERGPPEPKPSEPKPLGPEPLEPYPVRPERPEPLAGLQPQSRFVAFCHRSARWIAENRLLVFSLLIASLLLNLVQFGYTVKTYLRARHAIQQLQHLSHERDQLVRRLEDLQSAAPDDTQRVPPN
jgi:hypothetical protein